MFFLCYTCAIEHFIWMKETVLYKFVLLLICFNQAIKNIHSTFFHILLNIKGIQEYVLNLAEDLLVVLVCIFLNQLNRRRKKWNLYLILFSPGIWLGNHLRWSQGQGSGFLQAVWKVTLLWIHLFLWTYKNMLLSW